jgi:hypothetical protein
MIGILAFCDFWVVALIYFPFLFALDLDLGFFVFVEFWC